MLDSSPNGLLHSEISGSKCVCHSPELIAAYHVLHRLAMPRHPPCALSRLVVYFKKLSFRSHELGSVSTCVETKHTCMSCILDFFCCQRAKIRYGTAFLFSCLFSNRLMVGVTGVGPVTSSLSGTRSNQLSYTPSSVLSSPMFGGGSRTRTGDIRLAKPTLYQLSYAPVETHSDAPALL